MLEKIDDSWQPILGPLYREPLSKLNHEILPNIQYYPSKDNIFRVFQMPLKNIKVVILGQDPYPTPKMATGLAFENGIPERIPPSLKVIYKEILNSTNMVGDISNWTSQGVFLLNTALTVESGRAGSHLVYWKEFIDTVIRYISKNQKCIWLLWGKYAQQYQNIISSKLIVNRYDRQLIEEIPISDYNYVITAPHPAAEIYQNGNAGFYGCDCFYKSNIILTKQKSDAIIW